MNSGERPDGGGSLPTLLDRGASCQRQTAFEGRPAPGAAVRPRCPFGLAAAGCAVTDRTVWPLAGVSPLLRISGGPVLVLALAEPVYGKVASCHSNCAALLPCNRLICHWHPGNMPTGCGLAGDIGGMFWPRSVIGTPPSVALSALPAPGLWRCGESGNDRCRYH